jgi:L-ascorbate metabolism protein UlaG (beta-lactamase superfamily)
VIDPGIYTRQFEDFANIAVIVITHKHADHFDPQLVGRIISHNPDVRIFTVAQVAEKLPRRSVTVVHDGDELAAEPFRLSFWGEWHASVHSDWPSTVQNTGVYVNDSFYYAGDSLTLPKKPVRVLAAPVSYAWLKMSDAMDFVATVGPAICFTTHDNPLSEYGKRTAADWMTKICEKHGIGFRDIKPGESLEA